MKRQIVLCGLFRYPRGNATSNYIQYLATALKQAGYKVTILGYVNNGYTSDRKFKYRGVDVIDLENHCRLNMMNRLMNGKLFQIRMIYHLRKLMLTCNDLVITSDSTPISNPVFILKKILHFKTCGYPLEWFPNEFFKDPKRAQIREAEFQRNREHDLIFPISHFIAAQFKNSNVNIQVLPIMADTSEYEYIEKEEKKYEFIYPANGAMKDALNQMLHGLCGLNDDELSSIVFHIKGVDKNYILNEVGEEQWQRINQSIAFHGWMEYNELVKLYQSCHYMFLARETNQMTKANFPSKVPEVITHGVVPIVSRVGDYTKYYLEDGIDSLIFDGCEASQCTKALRRAIHMPFCEYRKLSNGARRCVEKKFDYRNWQDTIKNSIEAIF